MFFTREEVFNAACVCACVCALLAVSSAQLTEDEQQVILEQHNLRRAQVDPAAVYMRKMVRTPLTFSHILTNTTGLDEEDGENATYILTYTHKHEEDGENATYILTYTHKHYRSR